jgi:hypothetical protein
MSRQGSSYGLARAAFPGAASENEAFLIFAFFGPFDIEKWLKIRKKRY